MSATHVARNFSEILNRVHRGDELEIVRNGVPVAELRPAPGSRTMSAHRWRELMATAPPVDADFPRELERAREGVGPPTGAWPS